MSARGAATSVAARGVLLSLALLLLGGLGGGRRAHAAGEAEWQASARLGTANVQLGTVDPRAPWGLAAALDLEYGFTDAWAARVSVGASEHPVDADMTKRLAGGNVSVTTALAGVTYTFDVLRLVPYAELSVGFVRFGGAVASPHTTLATELGVGADYLFTRHWAGGVVFQYLFSPSDLLSDAMNLGSSPYTFSATLRASRIF